MGRTAIWVLVTLLMGAGAYYLILDDGGPNEDIGFIEDPTVTNDGDGGPELQGGGTVGAVMDEASESGTYVLAGTVLDEYRKPAAGVKIVVRRTGRAWDPSNPRSWYRSPSESIRESLRRMDQPTDSLHPVIATIASKENGTFRVAFNKPGKFELAARPSAPLFGTKATVSVHESKPTNNTTFLYVMKGSRLVGRVVDAKGRGVSTAIDARWWSSDFGERRNWTLGAMKTNTNDGSFVIPAAPPGRIHFTLYLSATRSLHGPSIDTPYEGELLIRIPTTGSAIEGTVTDVKGEPIGGASLLIHVSGKNMDNEESASSATVRALTAADGTYHIANAPHGEVSRVRGIADGFLALQLGPHSPQCTEKSVEHDATLTLDFTMSRGGTVVGRVTEKDSGRPIEDAEVTLFPSRSNRGGTMGARLSTTTDAAGIYRIEGVAIGRYIAVPQKEGYYLPEMVPGASQQVYVPNRVQTGPSTLTVIPTSEGSAFKRDLVLARGHVVRGRVLDSKGTGVESAQIYARGFGLQQVAWQWGIQPGANTNLGKSEADGSFEVSSLPPKAGWVLFAKKQPYAGVYSSPFRLAEDEKTPEVILKLVDGATLRGKVIDSNGEPLQGAQISFWGNGSELAGEQGSKRVGADGTFELTGVPAGDWTINVWMQGRQGTPKQIVDVKPGEVREGIEITIAEGVEVTGVLVDPEGKPVKNQQLMLQGLNGGAWLQGRSDKEGKFAFKGAKKGRVQLIILNSGQSTKLGEPFEAPATDVRIVYEEPETATIQGRIIGPNDKLIPVCSVSIAGVNDSRSANAFIEVSGSRGFDVMNGEFTHRVSGAPPFTVRVASARDASGKPLNLMPESKKVDDPSGTVVIKLRAGMEISGIVVDEKGKGVPGLPLRVGETDSVTGPDGRFSVGGLRKGMRNVHLSRPPGYVRPPRRQVKAGTTDVRIELSRGVAIKGTALGPDDEPLKQGNVSANWKASGATMRGSSSGQVQADGSFVIEGIPEHVRCNLTLQVWNHQGGQTFAPTTVHDVAPGTDDLVIKIGSGLALEGVVIDADGEPVTQRFVTAQTKKSKEHAGWVRTDSKGRWKIAGLKAETYLVNVMRSQGQAAPDPIEVVAPKTGIRIQLPKTISMGGRIVGMPADEANSWRVTAYRAGKLIGSTRPKSDGSWTMNTIADGSAIVFAAQSSLYTRYARSEPMRGAKHDVVLRLVEGNAISGIVDGDGDGLDNVAISVEAEGQDPWHAGGQLDKQNGTFTIRGLPPGRYKVIGRRYLKPMALGERTGIEAGTDGVRITLRKTN